MRHEWLVSGHCELHSRPVSECIRILEERIHALESRSDPTEAELTEALR